MIDWIRLPVKRIATCTLGKMVQTEKVGPADELAPYLRAAHVQPSGRLVELDEQPMWFSPAERDTLDLRRGDVVVVEGGAGYGRSAVITEPLPGWGFQNSIIRVRPQEGRAEGRFIDYAIQSALLSGEIEILCNTATIPHFTAEKVASLRVPAPKLDEQRAIADFLDEQTSRIDTLIDKQARLIDSLGERRRVVVERMVTLGSDPGLQLRPSGIGWAPAMPDSWSRGRLKWDASLTAGGTPDTAIDDYWLRGDDEGGVPWVSIADMSRRSLVTKTAKSLSEDGLSARGLPVGRPGTILLAMYASVGEVAELGIRATWNQALLGIETGPELSKDFIRYVLLAMRPHLLAEVRSNTQANLNARQVGDIWYPRPPIAEQRKIVTRLDEQTSKIETLIAKTQEHIALAKERRAALITAAVTGQIDVRTAGRTATVGA